MIFKKTFNLGMQISFGGPGFGDQHGQGMGRTAAGNDQQLKGIVQTGGIRAAFNNHRIQVSNPFRKNQVGKESGPGPHPVDVTPQRVDLAVVGNISKRLGQIPGRKSIGTVALMDKSNRADQAFIVQFGIEGIQLFREQHPLVKNCLAGERADVEHLIACQLPLANGVFRTLAGQIQHQLKLLHLDAAPADEHLHHSGFHSPGIPADHAAVRTDCTPAQHHTAYPDQLTVQNSDAVLAERLVAGQKNQPGAVVPKGRQTEGADFAVIGVGNLNHQPRAITIEGISTNRAPMSQVAENLDPTLDDTVTFLPFDVGDKTDTAIIMFICGVIKALGGRHVDMFFHSCSWFLEEIKSRTCEGSLLSCKSTCCAVRPSGKWSLRGRHDIHK